LGRSKLWETSSGDNCPTSNAASGVDGTEVNSAEGRLTIERTEPVFTPACQPCGAKHVADNFQIPLDAALSWHYHPSSIKVGGRPLRYNTYK